MEDLQQMEARAIAAEERALKSEYCLLKLRQYLDDHADVEDRPDTNEVRPNDYMCVLIAMDTMLIDTTAARELIEKAERYEEVEACAKELYSVLKEAYNDDGEDPLRVFCLALACGLSEKWLAGKIENGYVVGLLHKTEGPITIEFRKEGGKTLVETHQSMRNEADTLRTRLRESEALVERLKKTLQLMCDKIGTSTEITNEGLWADWRVAKHYLVLNPSAALAEYRGEVLEEMATKLDDKANCYKPPHAEYAKLAAEIRIMKEKK